MPEAILGRELNPGSGSGDTDPRHSSFHWTSEHGYGQDKPKWCISRVVMLAANCGLEASQSYAGRVASAA
jgi:hypothetical protein